MEDPNAGGVAPVSIGEELSQEVAVLPEEDVAIAEMQPHPDNPYEHPEDEIEHIRASLRNNGVYRNVILAEDGTLLAGHGVIESATLEGMITFPARRTKYHPDDPQALALLIGDNETPRRAIRDDRKISEMLKKVREADPELLLGTGYDDETLAALAMVTRPSSEIADMDEAAHWVGMPDYEAGDVDLKVVVHFESAEDREEFARLLGQELSDKQKTVWFPEKERDDVANVRFEA